jgi:MFS family permease
MVGRAPWQRLTNEFHSLPGVFWTLWLGTLINRSGGFVVPFLSLYVTHQRHESNATAGLVLSLYGAGSVLASLCGGMLADRAGRRTTMLISLFGGSFAMLSIGFANTRATLAASTFVMGAVAEMFRPAVSAMVADVVPKERRAHAFGRLYWVINLGYAIAPMLAALALKASYFLLFVVDAATMFVYALIVLFAVPESRPRGTNVAHGEELGLWNVLRDGPFMGLVVLLFGTTLVMGQNNTALPIDMTARGISESTYGLVVSTNGVLIVLLQPTITRLLSGRSRTRVLAISSLFFALGFGLYGAVETPLGYALAIAIWTLGEIAHLPTFSATVADIAPEQRRGRYQGVADLAWSCSALVGPLVSGAFLSGPGARALWVACFALMVGVCIGHASLGPARKRRELRSPLPMGES